MRAKASFLFASEQPRVLEKLPDTFPSLGSALTPLNKLGLHNNEFSTANAREVYTEPSERPCPDLESLSLEVGPHPVQY